MKWAINFKSVTVAVIASELSSGPRTFQGNPQIRCDILVVMCIPQASPALLSYAGSQGICQFDI